MDDTTTDNKPTLLKRGVIIPPDDASDARKSELLGYVAIDYIIKYIKDMKVGVKGPGDRVLVLESGTGSGKSTILPPRLMEFGRRQCVTEPRRKTAQEIPRDIVKHNPHDIIMGENIGFKTGILSVPNRKGLRFMTIGVLKQQILNSTSEQMIHRYSVIVIDEVHTHDLEVDFTLRLLKLFLEKNWTNERCPILILTSATMDPKRYLEYYNSTHHIRVAGAGKNFPVDEHWPSVAKSDNYSAIVQILKQVKGDTLVFMPTVKEIQNFATRVRKDLDDDVYELYSARLAQNMGEFQSLQAPSKKNRVIFATNVVETGITITYLKNVIDTGYAFSVMFNPVHGATMLFMDIISKAAATQRRGRVGRNSSGNYYPLYTKPSYEAMEPHSYPDIYTSDIAMQLLQLILKITGAEFDNTNIRLSLYDKPDALSLGLINQPLSDTVTYSFDQLYTLGYIDRDWNPTLLGYMAAMYQKISAESLKMIFSAGYYGCEPLYVITIAACVNMAKLFSGSIRDVATRIWGARIAELHCDFSITLMIYEEFVKHITAGDAKAWVIKMELDFNKWLDIIELRNDTLMTTLQLGFPVNYYCEPLVDIWERSKDEFDTAITRIKNCIYEGYRNNLCTWNSMQESYVRDYKNLTVSIKQYSTGSRPKYVIVDGVTMGVRTQSGQFTSVMDGVVEVDKTFLYL